jgi:hypothetical protein
MLNTVRIAAGGACLAIALGCGAAHPPEQQFYYEHIQPIFNNFCVGNTSACHRDAGGGIALGNLDLSSFDAVQKRRDVLRTYGSYPQPLLLLKSMPEAAVEIPYRGRTVTSEIRHAGGKPIAPDSDAYYELKRWLDAGATPDGLPLPDSHKQGQGACNSTVPPEYDLTMVDTNSAIYQEFVNNVWPVVQKSCAFGTCHSSPQADFYLTCGGDDTQLRFNFVQAAGFVVPAPANVEQSEILLRPLSPQAGGVSHTGGAFFSSKDDPVWGVFKKWAIDVQMNPVNLLPAGSAGQMFFQANVMPMLLARGCALEGCHSPDGFNDFRVRPGAQGFFSPLALKRNYEAALQEFMALDTPDVKQSRAVKKPIFISSGGITHRGGPVLETPGHDVSETCPQPYDPTMAPTAFCTLKEWHRIERQDHAAQVSALAQGDTVTLAFITRPPDDDSLLQFDNFRGGADLRLADATIGADGHVDSVGNVRSALGSCAGLTAGAGLDVRGPEWSYDGSKLVFAARTGTSSGLDLWVLDVGASTCARLTNDNGRMQGPVRVHNFDPAFAPDGTIVFASTRAGTLTLKTLLPNSDLFRVAPGGDFANPEQMTFLLNSELSPAFMQDGRMTFTAEKATADFYQLSGRRMNWDLTDYHPLLAQRDQSTDTFTDQLHNSIGYEQATEIREGLDRNFLIILSNRDAHGAGGALATFNRSIGPFELGRNDVTFLQSVEIVDPAATGVAGTQGIYRSPFSLPNGEILASYAGNVTDPTAQTPQYDLVAVDPRTGTRRTLLSGGGQSLVEAALGYKRVEREQFRNLPQLVFGGHSGNPAAVMHFPDLPMLATLLGANLRRGRNVSAFDSATGLRVYVENPPPSAQPDPAKMLGSEHVYTDRTPLGTAPLESDHSVKVEIPPSKPLILEVVDGGGRALFTMREEHQLSPGEYITPGVSRTLFNNICGGCHGSVSGRELDIAVSADTLTGASVSASRDLPPKSLQ